MAIKLAPNAFDFPEGAAPATPDTGYVRLYAKTDNLLYSKDDAGVETALGGGGVLNNFTAPAAPTPNDDSGDGYSPGSLWIDTSSVAQDLYYCAVNTLANATWWEIGTTSTPQTLTFKTLSSPTIANFTNATHNHTNAAGGGTLSASVIASGTLVHERGGLEADVSAYSGLVKITGGATSAVTAPTGAIVGTTDTQSLTNKDLTDATNTFAATADGITLTDPTAQTWTNENHGGGTYTEDTTNKRLVMREDGNASRQVRGWYFTAPSAPYIATFYVQSQAQHASGNGMVLYHRSSGGLLRTFGYRSNGTSIHQLTVSNWNSATSINANVLSGLNFATTIRWWQIEDDNTDVFYRISPDGIIWQQIYTVGRTSFLTPNALGFGMDLLTASTYDASASLLSLELA